MARIAIDGRESGTSTGRYVDKLVEYLHELKPAHEIIVLAKAGRVGFMKTTAPNFQIVESNYKEFTFAEQIGFLKQLNGLGADLVHFAMTQQPILYRNKSVTTIHDLTTARFNNPAKNIIVYKFKQAVYKWLIKKVARQSLRIITPSQFIKDDVAQYTNVAPSKISVTYEAADKIDTTAESLPALAGKQFLLFVGRSLPHKNLGRLIDAFAILKAKHPNLQLALVGKSDANYEKLRHYAADNNLKDIVFTGYMSEANLCWLYENTAAYVFPSLSEGFGLPGLEAMAHGAPVVSSNATCLPEIYGKAALYFDPKDPADMAEKINEVLSSSKIASKLRQSGFRQASKYSWRRMVKQTTEVYKQALS